MTEEVILKTEEKITKHDFYFETSLYEPIKVGDFDEDILKGDVDAYSSKNHIDTTYHIHSWNDIRIRSGVFKRVSGTTIYSIEDFVQIELKCKRREDDTLTFFVFINKDTITKIGQLPSLADIQFAELGKKYDKVLTREDLKNLKKAIGLHAHGAGAGSFVYMRRIFENLIFETFNEHKDTLRITEEEFNKEKMTKKVEKLKDFLPEQLVAMKAIYSILSNGVHELSEEACLKYFLPIKMSIELILDQKIELKKKQERDIEARKAIEGIMKELK